MSDESEESCLVNSKSHTTGNQLASSPMPYTDGNSGSSTDHSSQLNRSSNAPGHRQQATSRGSQQSQISETGELIELNDELMLSQFHSDAIKQVEGQLKC